MKFISVVSPCFNEEDNVSEVYQQVKGVFTDLADYQYEHIFIDNASTDSTVSIVKALAQNAPKLKIVVNTRKFGHIRSPMHGILQAHGNAVIVIASDLQDPPALIKKFADKS